MEIKNAKITSTMLGKEDHGILTCSLGLEYDKSSGQSFGGYDLRLPKYLMLHITKILEVVGVDTWEELRGKYIRVEAEHHKIRRIGNLLEDKWFDPEA